MNNLAFFNFKNVKYVLKYVLIKIIKIIKIYLITCLISICLLQILSFINLLQYLYLSNCLSLSNLNQCFKQKLCLLSNYSDSEDEIVKPDLNKPLPPLPEEESDWEKDFILKFKGVK